MLFLELREIEKLAREDTFEHSWVMELLRELTEAIFSWMSNEETNSDVDDDNATIRYPKSLPQVCLFLLLGSLISKSRSHFLFVMSGMIQSKKITCIYVSEHIN